MNEINKVKADSKPEGKIKSFAESAADALNKATDKLANVGSASTQYYVATKEGFDGFELRKPGQVFAYKGEAGSWMRPADSKEQKFAEQAALEEGHENGEVDPALHKPE